MYLDMEDEDSDEYVPLIEYQVRPPLSTNHWVMDMLGTSILSIVQMLSLPWRQKLKLGRGQEFVHCGEVVHYMRFHSLSGAAGGGREGPAGSVCLTSGASGGELLADNHPTPHPPHWHIPHWYT